MSLLSDWLGTSPDRVQAQDPSETLGELTEARLGLLPSVVQAETEFAPQLGQLQTQMMLQQGLGLAGGQQGLEQLLGYGGLRPGIAQAGLGGLGAGLQPAEQTAIEQFGGLGATPQELEAMQAYQTGLGQALGAVEGGAPEWMTRQAEQGVAGDLSARGLGWGGISEAARAQALTQTQEQFRLPYMQMAQQYAGGLAGLGAGIEQRRLGGLEAAAGIAGLQREATGQGFGQAVGALGTVPQLSFGTPPQALTYGGLGQQPAYIPPSETGGGGILSGLLPAAAGQFAGAAGYGLGQRYF